MQERERCKREQYNKNKKTKTKKTKWYVYVRKYREREREREIETEGVNENVRFLWRIPHITNGPNVVPARTNKDAGEPIEPVVAVRGGSGKRGPVGPLQGVPPATEQLLN